MGGRGSSSSAGRGQGTTIAQASNYAFSGTFKQISDKDAQDMRDLEDSRYDANTTGAIKMYISNTNYDGNGHSLSQTLNYKLEQGMDISSDASLSYTDALMHASAHQLGKDIKLQRGAHTDLIQQLGVKNYSKMTEAQLQKALVGKEGDFKAYVSTSYDLSKNPFLSASSGSGVSGGREIKMNINAKGSTKGLFGAKSQSEIVLDKGTNFKVTGVRYVKDSSGNQVYATPRGKSAVPQVEIDIETW